MARSRIVIVGAGIAGSLITAGLAGRDDVEVVCLERATSAGHADAGTGLNLGPNAIKCLAMHLPRSAAAIVAASLPWRRWTVSLTDGQLLMDLELDRVADNPGVRIRWAALYALLRAPIAAHIRYGTEVVACEAGPAVTTRDVASGALRRMDGIDLLIAADGRYSAIRDHALGAQEAPSMLGVCLFRVLFAAGADCPIDDYGQWFHGPNRLLAFRVPGDFVYCAGSFPIAADAAVDEAMKTAAFLRRAYTPAQGALSREAGALVDAIAANVARIHWARLQDGEVAYGRAPGILLVGDSAHPMVPTLGQGATQACEDACVVVDEIRAALAQGWPLGEVPGLVEARRAARVRFVAAFSREATDTMLAGADPVAGTRRKTEPAFLAGLERLYRDVPSPLHRHDAAARACLMEAGS